MCPFTLSIALCGYTPLTLERDGQLDNRRTHDAALAWRRAVKTDELNAECSLSIVYDYGELGRTLQLSLAKSIYLSTSTSLITCLFPSIVLLMLLLLTMTI